LLKSGNVVIVADVAASPSSGDGPTSIHGFHTVGVREVVHETSDARSFVLEVPDELRAGFAYRAGQFVTVRVHLEGSSLLRCYSMSSAPEVDDALAVTVKRVPGGAVSNWLVDQIRAGDELEVTFPAGTFQLTGSTDELIAFAAGSGITPIMSLVRSALATSDRAVRVLYANRDRESTIFAKELDRLVHDAAGRLQVEHRWDVEHGFVDPTVVRTFLGDTSGASDVYVCGPTPFMDVVESSLLDRGVDPTRIHIERFGPPRDPLVPGDTGEDTVDASDTPEADGTAPPPRTVVVEIDGRSGTAEYREGTTVLQTARQLGLDPPYSCEAGSCATCMARLVEGTVTMHVNDALTDAEVDEGWVLTCQSVPTSPTVHVVYGFD
jgi:3-ketosteroid 9alpha-monooxygenase subunit B